MTIVVEETGLGLDYSPQLCNRCGICLEVCPFAVWELPEEGPAVIARPEDCTNCTACAKNCLGAAISVKNIGCGCVWNEAARRKGRCDESVVGTPSVAEEAECGSSTCCE
ncbi:MAG: 4Fe-4S dicluster domain-containing protein [Candidatus Thorarchaeota archaeon]